MFSSNLVVFLIMFIAVQTVIIGYNVSIIKQMLKNVKR